MNEKELKLAAHVRAVNLAVETGHAVFHILHNYFKQFEGQKIEKADGSLLLKVEKGIPEDQLDALANRAEKGKTNLRIYQSGSQYSLMWTINADAWYPCSGGYDTQEQHSVSVYVGNLSNGVLKSLYQDFTGRYDWTVPEIEQGIIALREAEAAYSKAYSALGPFAPPRR